MGGTDTFSSVHCKYVYFIIPNQVKWKYDPMIHQHLNEMLYLHDTMTLLWNTANENAFKIHLIINQ